MGGTLYSTTGFFVVQTILTNRYIHRSVVSGIIKKPVQRRIKNQKDFCVFRFLERVIVLLIVVHIRPICVIFNKIFRNFCLKFRQFC